MTISAAPIHAGPPPLRDRPSCADCPIRYRAVCAHCEGEELLRLERAKYYRRIPAGQVILCAGERMDFVASLIDGVATLTQTLEDGRTQMVGLMLPSDFLGRPGRDRAGYTVTAITDLNLCCFRRAPFEAMMRDTPRLPARLLEMTLDELDAAREWMVILGRKTARERIASFLAILARRAAALKRLEPRGQIRLALPLTREAMADYLGLTLETVSRQFSALKRDGVIRLREKREVEILDFDRLLVECGDGEGAG
ncbi:CRP/FNR family transcriptional regulator, anaerobic regulatory protein [Paracoccus isoporae]|uniref:CRP/FNR family transcriptional regulator, anaerobic regulatory protein n=1 Tax=Paracoccus isoporae TaxID=591205 RepID=A0A1G7ERS7_9RHOB|nr:Crp/Fnr family transcriptional regulator [Paracoccus isoporae]SDE66400.1 CRP/FNR family transcriptional regulator, anaerobic regulatory protein [Paracoccus isoporae]